MSVEAGSLRSLVEQIKEASTNIFDGDARTNARIDELAKSVKELYLKANRPGASWERRQRIRAQGSDRAVAEPPGADRAKDRWRRFGRLDADAG